MNPIRQASITCLVDQSKLITPSKLSEKIALLMKNASNITHHQLSMFLKTYRVELSAFAIKTPSNWLLFSQSMQRQFTTKSKIARLLKRLNFFIKTKDRIHCNQGETFSQIIPKELRQIFAFTIPPSFPNNSATLEKMRLLLLEDKPSKDFFKEIKGIPVKDLAAWINLFQVPLHTLKITEGELNLLLPKLEYVDLGGYPQGKIASILTKLKNARHLSCNHITDYTLQTIGTYKWLTSLNLSHSSEITDEGLENLAELTELINLDLSHCDQITDDGIEHLMHLTKLIYLNIADCTQITDSTLAMITIFTKLKSLVVMGCHELTDEGLANLIVLKELTHLNISDCSQITGIGLEALNPHNRLIGLELSFCKEITDADLKIIEAFTNLKWLKLNGCTQITKQAIKSLKDILTQTTIGY